MKQFQSVIPDGLLVRCMVAAFVIFAGAGVTVLAAVPQTTTYQGRLLDASDQPLSGSFTLVFSIFDSPTGGVPLWMEDHVGVTVTGGLFSVELGSTVPLSADVFTGGSAGTSTRYLEIQLAGQAPLAPRLALASVPSALTAGRVSGDVVTSPGSLTATDETGTSSASVLALQPLGGQILVHNESATGSLRASLIGSELNLIDDRDFLGLRSYSASVTADSASSGLTADLDGDGIFDGTIWQKVDNSDLDVAMVVDVDDDGVPDVGTTVNAIVSRSVLKSFFERGDKPTQSQFATTIDEFGARHAINTKGTGGTSHRTVSSSTDESAASIILEADFDGDGVPEGLSAQRCTADSVVHESSSGDGSSSSVHNVRVRVNDLESKLQHIGILSRTTSSSSCDDAGATQSLEKKGLNAVNVRRSISSSVDDVEARHWIDDDSDDDGVPEASLALSIGLGVTAVKATFTPPGSAHAASSNESITTETESRSLLATDLDDDGVPENEASLHVTPTTSSMAIKTKGTGADKNRTAASSTSDLTSVSSVCSVDRDDDGVEDFSATTTCSTTASEYKLQSGFIYATAPSSARLVVDSSDGPSLSLEQNGTVIHVMNGDGTVIRSSAGTVEAQIGSDGVAFFHAKVGIGVATPTAALEVAGGAYCDGTSWVNASDANSKENFAPVDGRELLDQISDLEITKWNYKGDEETAHIGPTAQDFRETFGVGSDGKSISTIDPSGIALAAIKELSKQNQELEAQSRELRKQNGELKRQLDELAGKVNELLNHK